MSNIIFSVSTGVNDSIFGKSQAPIRAIIEKRGEELEKESIIPTLFNRVKSNHFAEKFTATTSMDGFRPVGENGALPIDGMRESYSKTIEPTTWKDQFSVSREAMEDAVGFDLKGKPKSFIASYYRTTELLAGALYGGAMGANSTISFRGFTFDITTADGKPLFDSGHTSILGNAAQTNKFSDAFSVDALSAAECAMQDFRGDNNEILDVSPDTIVIPNIHTLKKAVFEAIGADKDPATANNGFNYQYGRWNVIVTPYFKDYITAGTSPWMLIDSRYNDTYHGAIWLDRTALEVNSYIDNSTDANVWKGYSRFNAGFNDWRFACVGGVTSDDALISG